MGKKNAQRILKNSQQRHLLHQQGLLSSLIAWTMPRWKVSLGHLKRNVFMVGNLTVEKR